MKCFRYVRVDMAANESVDAEVRVGLKGRGVEIKVTISEEEDVYV